MERWCLNIVTPAKSYVNDKEINYIMFNDASALTKSYKA